MRHLISRYTAGRFTRCFLLSARCTHSLTAQVFCVRSPAALSPETKREIFQDAIKFWTQYINEMQVSLTKTQLHLLHKNCGFASFEIAKVCFARDDVSSGASWTNLFFEFLFKSSRFAALDLPRVYSKLDDLLASLAASAAPLGAKLTTLESITKNCPAKSILRCKLFCKQAELLLNAGVVLLEEASDFSGAHHKFHDALPLIHSAESCHESEIEIVREVLEIERRLRIQLAITSSRRHRKRGDVLFQSAVLESENLDYDKLYDALDEYKQAQQAASKLDIEGEAVASARIGKVWYRILKNREKAREFCRNALTLGMTLSPRDLSPTEWWQETQVILNEIQRQTDKEAQEEEDKINGPIMEALQPKLKRLRAAAADSDDALLQLLRTEFLPDQVDLAASGLAESQAPAADLSQSDRKRRLLKAVRVYHPDRWASAPTETRILYQEITKILNSKWAEFK